MKKMIALFAAITMALGMSVSVAAEEIGTVDLTVTYEAVNAGTDAPAETFEFTVTKEDVQDAASTITVDTMPMLQYDNQDASVISIAFDEAGTLTEQLTLPEYSSVGTYTYKIIEKEGSTAGTVYDDKAILVNVTVLKNDQGALYVAGVSYNNVGGTKMTDGEGFLNQFLASSVSVSKTVSGNMADDTKEFAVKVRFTAPEGKNVSSVSNYYSDGTEEKEVSMGEEITIYLKHEDTVVFDNLPYGVSYTVEEEDYTGEGYELARYTLNNVDKGTTSISEVITDSVGGAVVITNHKDSNIATGVVLDNLPYVLLLAVVVGGAVIMFLRKRSYERD